MTNTDPERLFNNLPKQVSFSLDTGEQFPHGLFWFADKDGNIPDGEGVWRGSFGASEEEIAFSNNSGKTRRFLLKQKLFGIPYRHVASDNDMEDGDITLGIGLGKKPSGNSMLYAVTIVPDGPLAIGRVKANAWASLTEDVVLFYLVSQKFFVHPSRIASGKDGFCMEDHEPSTEEELLGPWNFTGLHGSSLEELKLKAASTLASIHSPDRLWAAFLRIDWPILDAAVFSLVEAGGKILDAPEMLFETATDIVFGSDEEEQPLRLLFFWQ